MTSTRRFRWGQFSIRTVLLITFGVACYFGGWAARQWRYEREVEAAAREAEAEAAQAQANANAFWWNISGVSPGVSPALPLPGQPPQSGVGGMPTDPFGVAQPAQPVPIFDSVDPFAAPVPPGGEPAAPPVLPSAPGDALENTTDPFEAPQP